MLELEKNYCGCIEGGLLCPERVEIICENCQFVAYCSTEHQKDCFIIHHYVCHKEPYKRLKGYAEILLLDKYSIKILNGFSRIGYDGRYYCTGALCVDHGEGIDCSICYKTEYGYVPFGSLIYGGVEMTYYLCFSCSERGRSLCTESFRARDLCQREKYIKIYLLIRDLFLQEIESDCSLSHSVVIVLNKYYCPPHVFFVWSERKMKRGVSVEREEINLRNVVEIDELVRLVMEWLDMRSIQAFLETIFPLLLRNTLSNTKSLLDYLSEKWPILFQKTTQSSPYKSLFQFFSRVWCECCQERESVYHFGEAGIEIDLCRECDERMTPPESTLLSGEFREDGWQWITGLETVILLGTGLRGNASTQARENGIRFRDPRGPDRKYRILGTDQYHSVPQEEMYLLKDVYRLRIKL